MPHGQQVQFHIPRMGMVIRTILIVSVVMFLLQLIGEQFFHFPLSAFLGFVPARLASGWIWQPFTYAFLHGGIWHLVFNLFILWSVGSELEQIWSRRFFLLYFFGCAVGAALTYGLFASMGVGGGPFVPVVGSSGAVYGFLLAYGILFGERVLYFFMIFPIKAKYFVMILGGIVLVSTVFYSDGGVAHTAHLGGMVVGLIILLSVTKWKQLQARSSGEGLDKWRLDKQQHKRKQFDQASYLKVVGLEDKEGSEKKDDKTVWH